MKALITGITGQDGSYLAELLLSKHCEVHGMIRRSSTPNTRRIDHLLDHIQLRQGDITDANGLASILKEVKPDEIYNLAAMSHVRHSYDVPEYTQQVTGLGCEKLLGAMRNVCPDAKFYQASSSEMFGKVQETPQRETTPFYPRSPYGRAKVYAFNAARSYREGYGMRVYNGILFNHESPRRGDEFLSKKVVKAAVAIKQGKQSHVTLGNLEAKRDWGYAKEYVEWIYRIVQGEPDDFVICTGETHTVREFVAETFQCLGLNWEEWVRYDSNLSRAAEVDLLQGDYSKSKALLGFEPKIRFKELIKLMVEAELNGTY